MKQPPAILVTLTAFLSLLVVLVLYIGADKGQNYAYASFTRNFVHGAIELVDTINLQHYNYYFSGNTKNTVYLANSKAPGHLLSVDANFTDTAHYNLLIANDSLWYRSIRVTVDSPYFYMSDGSQPFVYQGTINSRIAAKYLDNVYFKKVLPVSSNSLALISMIDLKTTLGKRIKGEQRPTFFPDLLQEQGEGIFSTDGMFLYNKKRAQLIYVYYYRNQYICMDTSLNLLYRAYTIDTITQAKIKTANIKSEKSFSMSSPPLVTNNKSATVANRLYINSNLLGKNEDRSVFENQSVIDVYNLDTKGYLFSFYLPSFNDRKATDFVLTDSKTLIVICQPYVLRYTIEEDYKTIIAQ